MQILKLIIIKTECKQSRIEFLWI